jgi:hypothetical protein
MVDIMGLHRNIVSYRDSFIEYNRRYQQHKRQPHRDISEIGVILEVFQKTS